MEEGDVKHAGPSEDVQEGAQSSGNQGTEAAPPPQTASIPHQGVNAESGQDRSGSTGAALEAQKAMQAEVEEMEEKLLRARADFQNFQRRAAIERAEAVRYANAEAFKSLLGVIDDLERCLNALNATDNLDAVLQGIRLVYDNLVRALQEHGLEEIDAVNAPFDPAVHEAILQQESSEHPPGKVIEQVAKGYRLKDRVLRPARVIVSKAPPPAADNEGDETDAPRQNGGRHT